MRFGVFTFAGVERDDRGAGLPAPVGPGLTPLLEDSIENKTWVVRPPEDVAESTAFYRDAIGVDAVTLIPQFGGDPYGHVEDQLHRFAQDVVPLLG